MTFLLTLLTALPQPTPFPQPLAMFSTELLQETSSGAKDGDVLLTWGAEACPTRAVSTVRAMGGALSMLERLQLWLTSNPGVEQRLYGRKDAVARLFQHVSEGRPAATGACRTPALREGWQWSPGVAGGVCAGKPPAASERWLETKKKPSGAVRVSAATDPCQPRLSIALFDATGKNRVVLNADFGGELSAMLVGDRCQLWLTFDKGLEAFKPEWKSCKG